MLSLSITPFGSTSELEGFAAVEVAAEPLHVFDVHLVERLAEAPFEGPGDPLGLVLAPEVSPGLGKEDFWIRWATLNIYTS